MVVILLLLNFPGRNSTDEIKIIQEFCSEFCLTSILQLQNKHPILMLIFFQKNEFADFKKKLENVFFDKNKN